jgi:uncharacterized BrkB/YihY/UPF0761 family membrane protein
MNMEKGYKIARSAAGEFSHDSAMTLGASLAFYGALSLVPLLLILLAVTALLGPGDPKTFFWKRA